MKNLLSENMLRFGTKNLNEMTKQNIIALSEQNNRSTVANITLHLDDIMATGNPTRINYENTAVFSFPKTGQTLSGKTLGTAANDSYIYKMENNYYAIIGNIGTCVEKNNNWHIMSPEFQVLVVLMSPYNGSNPNEGEGNIVRLIKQIKPAGNAASNIKAIADAIKIQKSGLENWLEANYEPFKTIYVAFGKKYPENLLKTPI
jgi:hypothetical protein